MILTKLRNNESVTITESFHYVKRAKRDYCSSKLSYNVLKKHIPLFIKPSKKNKFRITFSHLETNKYNLVIIIFIETLDKIRLVSTFPESKSKLKED